MKTKTVKRAISAATLVVLMLALCGCNMPKRSGNTQGEKKTEQTETTAAPVAENDAEIVHDAVIDEHIRSNQKLGTQKKTERDAQEFHFYIANTETMTGFVNCREISQFQEGLKSAFDVAHDQFSVMDAHVLNTAKGSNKLEWEQKSLDDTLERELQDTGAYMGKALPETGPLTMLFRQDESPFTENSLTLIVSNFVEPSFDMNALATGIEKYFDSYLSSAACVIGFRSQFQGEMHVPLRMTTKGAATHQITNFSGEVPCYMILVGPEKAVRSFSTTLFKYFDSRKVSCSSALYTNSVYDQIVAPVLEFDIVADQKAKKASAPLLSSYNTGMLTKSEYGNAYFATYSSVETTDAKSGRKKGEEENRIPVGASTQIALLSKNYDGASIYGFDYNLYVYDSQTKDWEDAGKNALAQVSAYAQCKDGELSEEIGNKNNVLLTVGRKEVYIGAILNFSDDEILSRNKIYRLEGKLQLNRKNPEARSEAADSELPGFSITSADYYRVVNALCPLSGGNYIWTGWNGAKGWSLEASQDTMAHTPNLDAFLGRLAQLETKYQPADEYIQYLDFVFNLPDKNSKR